MLEEGDEKEDIFFSDLLAEDNDAKVPQTSEEWSRRRALEPVKLNLVGYCYMTFEFC